MNNKTPVVIVAGLGKHDRAIGYKNNLLWHVPEDLKRFKALTLGHPIIMGKKTFESILTILGKPFPGRTNIVLTHDADYAYEGVLVAHSIKDALALAELEHPTEIHIGGGAELYKQILPRVSKLYITWYYDQKEADTFFPEFEDEFDIAQTRPTQHHGDLEYQWIDYVRI